MTYSISRSILMPLLGVSLSVACSSTPTPKSAGDLSSAPMAKSSPASSAPAEGTGTVSIDDKILRACHISNDDAYFAFDSAKLESRDVSPLDSVAKCFTRGELKGHSLKLVGRADPRGDDEYNLVLGQSRADHVGAALTRDGLDRTRMTSTSRGDLDAKGHDESGWMRDRRVDILLGS